MIMLTHKSRCKGDGRYDDPQTTIRRGMVVETLKTNKESEES